MVKGKLNFEWDQLVSTDQLGKLYYKTENWELYQLISFVTFRTLHTIVQNVLCIIAPDQGGEWWTLRLHSPRKALFFCTSHKDAFCLSAPYRRTHRSLPILTRISWRPPLEVLLRRLTSYLTIMRPWLFWDSLSFNPFSMKIYHNNL